MENALSHGRDRFGLSMVSINTAESDTGGQLKDFVEESPSIQSCTVMCMYRTGGPMTSTVLDQRWTSCHFSKESLSQKESEFDTACTFLSSVCSRFDTK